MPSDMKTRLHNGIRRRRASAHPASGVDETLDRVVELAPQAL